MSQQVINCVNEYNIASNTFNLLINENALTPGINSVYSTYNDVIDKWRHILEQECKLNNVSNVNYLLTGCPMIRYNPVCILHVIKNQNVNMIKTLRNHEDNVGGYDITTDKDCKKYLEEARKTKNQQLIDLVEYYIRKIKNCSDCCLRL